MSLSTWQQLIIRAQCRQDYLGGQRHWPSPHSTTGEDSVALEQSGCKIAHTPKHMKSFRTGPGCHPANATPLGRPLPVDLHSNPPERG